MSELDERAYVESLIQQIVDEYPERRATSEQERQAQELMRAQFAELGFDRAHIEPFECNDSLYKTMALHFGLGTLGTLVSGLFPWLGFGLHLAAGTSYWLDSTKRRYWLRRLFPFKPSQNLLVTSPAKRSGPPALRFVFAAHIDASFTGVIFHPAMLRRMGAQNLSPRFAFLGRSLAVATYCLFLLAGFDVLRGVTGPLAWPLIPVELLLTVPVFLAFVLNLEVVLRNEIVPGANDDLTGVAGMAILARRLVQSQPDDVEYVFCVTGAEEAGTVGARHLAETWQERWPRNETVIIGLDSLSNGELRYFNEGEVQSAPLARWLTATLHELIDGDERFAHIEPFRIPVGATDVLPFLVRGYDGVCLGCVDPEFGAPRHYHRPSDRPENIDPADVVAAVDFAEALVRRIEAVRSRKNRRE